jgi:NAD(P)-dependent dehydrogenase (short-subunit alcohol dehydrogenase family)
VDGQKLLLVKSDFSIEAFEIDMFNEISNFCDSIDLLINNAAIQGPIGPFSDLIFKDWERVFKVNFLAPAAICHRAIRHMMNGGGTIINLSGGGGAGLRPNFSAYGASKAALIRFSETIAAELADKNINVNTIAPGVMPTDMLQEVLESSDNVAGVQEKNSAMEAFRVDFDMTDIGDLCLFLSSEKARKITGKLISVKWDNWEAWSDNIEALTNSDLYTLRRIVGRDRGISWGDK